MASSSPLPIHEKLPTELLLDVFALITALPYKHDETLIFDGRYSPLYLGRICRAWRSIAWTTPSLWSAIGMKISDDSLAGHTEINSYQLGLLEQWLQRAQGSPLSIYLRVSAESAMPTPPTHVYELLIQKLVSRSKQWIYLDCRVPRASMRIPFAGIASQGGLPLLQTLIVENEVVPSQWLQSAPNLSRLIIRNRGWFMRIPPVDCVMPDESRLQHLSANWIQPNLFLDILRSSSPHIVSCQVTFYDRHSSGVGSPAIYLPRLSRLVISQGGTAILNDILDLIHCPSLSDLTLSHLSTESGTPLELPNILSQWSRNLISLTLSTTTLDELEDLIPTLQIIPSLRHLTLAYVYYHDPALDSDGDVEWKHLSHLLATDTTFLPTLDTFRLVYGFKENNPPAVAAYLPEIEIFRTLNFPLRNPVVPFKVTLYDNTQGSW
ncbi:hypothetical protein D9611_004219 [Ephemerocybe angulata]|uniref:F-box domain-containing protein n=1 Tax=Ephemerocybe angulata TaxID=980116 RepID=A0A8H5F602_9AGAR|nr:hypothetical protein D9611_004219 [Tulosesus angulatus]